MLDKKIPFQLPAEIRTQIHEEFGIHCNRFDQNCRALDDFKEAYELSPNQSKFLVEQSVTNLILLRPSDALKTVDMALEQNPNDLRAQIQRAKCLFDLNKFEDCKMYISVLIRNIPMKFQKECKSLLDKIEIVMSDSLMENAGDCLLNQRKTIERLYEIDQQTILSDDKPSIWLKRYMADECDVVSEIEMSSHEILLPIQKKRRELNQRLLSTTYMGTELAKDINYLKQLKIDDRLRLTQTQSTYELERDCIRNTIYKCDKIQETFRHRQPLYSKRLQMMQNVERIEKHKTIRMFHIQHATRRQAFIDLVKIRKYYKSGDFRNLMDTVNDVLNNFYAIKTIKVMPRRFEFVNEIVNIVGLAYLDYYAIPNGLMMHPQEDRMNILMRLTADESKPTKAHNFHSNRPTFGNRHDFKSPKIIDKGFLSVLNQYRLLSMQLSYARYPIEKCYLYLEIALANIKMYKYENALIVSRMALRHAEGCGNLVWQFLCHYTMARADRCTMNFKNVQYHLTQCLEMAKEISYDTLRLIKVAIMINDIDIVIKKQQELDQQNLFHEQAELRRKRKLAEYQTCR